MVLRHGFGWTQKLDNLRNSYLLPRNLTRERLCIYHKENAIQFDEEGGWAT